MIRAIILCCDEQNKKLGMKEYSVTPTPPSREQCYYDGAGVESSYGDGLNCGYRQERFSYSSGQSPSYTNYRMGWSTGYIHCQPANPRYHGTISTHHSQHFAAGYPDILCINMECLQKQYYIQRLALTAEYILIRLLAEGIISTPTPAPVKWRSRSASTGGMSGGREPGNYDDRWGKDVYLKGCLQA